MAEFMDEATMQDCELVLDDELLDDASPTRVSTSPRSGLASGSYARAFRPEQLRVGELLSGKYRVERVNRRGALGISVEAVHNQLGQRVAVRILAADPHAHPEAAARFLRGARAAVRFQNEHTARITDVGTLESGAPYIVTEYLSGSDLRRVLRVREALPVPEAVDYVLQACEGLADAHAHGIVHRNLKPTNLFLTRQEEGRRLKVLDFGVSEDPLSDAAINLGGTSATGRALAYMAPEQIREPNSVDSRADIWALGAILHELLTGMPLYDAPTTPALLAMIAADPPVPLTHLRPEIPAELESIVLRCLDKEPEGRYATLAELAGSLKAFASAEGHDSVERVQRVIGRRPRSSLPPPLPGQPTRAIVRVPEAPKAQPAAAMPAQRYRELAFTAVVLACAAAAGGFIAIRSMEGALAAAIAPRSVVADLSPALTAPAAAQRTADSLPLVANLSAAALPSAPAPGAAPAGAAQSASTPPLVTPTTNRVVPVTPLVVARVAVAPRRAAPTKNDGSEPAAVADAKPSVEKSSQPKGLFDDAN